MSSGVQFFSSTAAPSQKMSFLFLKFGAVHDCSLILVSVCNTLILPVGSSLVAAIPAIHFNQKSEIFNNTELQEAALTLWLMLGGFLMCFQPLQPSPKVTYFIQDFSVRSYQMKFCP